MKKKQVIPMGRSILVRKDVVKATFGEGPIVKADTTKSTDGRRTTSAVVLAVADEAYIDQFNLKQCKPGDRVIFRAFSGVKVGEEDEHLLLISDTDVLAIEVEVDEDE